MKRALSDVNHIAECPLNGNGEWLCTNSKGMFPIYYTKYYNYILVW